MNPTESFIMTHFNEVVSLIIAAALGWAGKAFYATIQEQKALKKSGEGSAPRQTLSELPVLHPARVC